MNIYEKILNLFDESNLSERELAESLNTSQTTINNIKKQKHNIKDTLIKEICEKFNVSADWLILDQEPIKLNEEEKEILNLLNKLSDKEKIELIGAMKMYVKENFNTQEESMNQIS